MTIKYYATALDTLPSIASRHFAKSNYGSHADLVRDIMSLNPDITDWSASLDGVLVQIPVSLASY